MGSLGDLLAPTHLQVMAHYDHLFDPSFLSKQRIQTISKLPGFEGSETHDYDDEEKAAIEKRLRDLGYL